MQTANAACFIHAHVFPASFVTAFSLNSFFAVASTESANARHTLSDQQNALRSHESTNPICPPTSASTTITCSFWSSSHMRLKLVASTNGSSLAEMMRRGVVTMGREWRDEALS